jgi:hypothetical protein
MAPLDWFIDEKTQANTVQENDTHSKDGANDDRMDINGIYGGKNDDVDGNFTYHSSDRLDEDDENGNEVLGNGADGTSPTMSTCGKRWSEFHWGKVGSLPDWLHEFETNNTYDASLLLAAPSPRFFCAPHASILTTPQHGFPFFCRRQAIPHGRCLMKTSAK